MLTLALLFPVFGSVVAPAFGATDAEFERTTPESTVDATVTWTVRVRLAPAARPLDETQVTACALAVQPAVVVPPLPLGTNAVPLGRVSLTVEPGAADGPAFDTPTDLEPIPGTPTVLVINGAFRELLTGATPHPALLALDLRRPAARAGAR